MLTPVTVLCTHRRSVYYSLPGVEVYDRARDARAWPGGTRVVCHAPCRAWSAHCSHQAKPEPGEKELGPFCVEQLRKWGGVLEHPAHSRLWDACGLPLPGHSPNASWWSAEVWQAWWGYPMQKRTWLLFSGINPKDVHFPILLHAQGGDRRTFQIMSKNQRSATPKSFAEWLIETARKSTFLAPYETYQRRF